jgi:hypothetical protein
MAPGEPAGRQLRILGAVVVLLLASVACAPQQMPRVQDTAGPRIEVTDPGDAGRVETFTPTIHVDYYDDRSGIRVVTFKATINGNDYSAEFDHHVRGAVGEISPVRPLPLGHNHLEVEVADRSGNIGRTAVDFVNAAGGWLHLKSVPGAAPSRYVEIVLDGSGSMGEALGLATRMEVAKAALRRLVHGVPARTPLGLRVFYDCGSIQALVPIKPVNKDTFLSRIDSIEPSSGTPLVESLLASFHALREAKGGQRVTVLVTDGAESCGGSLEKAVNRARDANTRVIVIGFDINSTGLLRQLSQLAEETGGAYFDARDEADLERVLEQSVLLLTYKVFDDEGELIGEGEVDGKPAEVPVGTVNVRLDTVPPVVIRDIEIGRLTETTVKLAQSGGKIRSTVKKPVSVQLPAAPSGL